MTPLGLDLSVRSTGVAIWGGTVSRIRTDLAAHAGWGDIEKRRMIGAGIQQVALASSSYPVLAVVEAPFSGPNRKTGRDLHMLHGVVLDCLHGSPVAYVPNSVAKLHLAGRGDADKQQMIAAAQACGYGGRQTDEADAYGLALIGHHLLGGTEHLTPQRAACLANVSWEVPLPAVPA